MSNVSWTIPGYVPSMPDTVTLKGPALRSVLRPREHAEQLYLAGQQLYLYERIFRAFGLSSEVMGEALREFNSPVDPEPLTELLDDPEPEGERKVNKKNNEPPPWSRDYKKQNQHLFKKKKR